MTCNVIQCCDSDAEIIKKQGAQLEELRQNLFDVNQILSHERMQNKASNIRYRYLRMQVYRLTIGWLPFTSIKLIRALLNNYNLK